LHYISTVVINRTAPTKPRTTIQKLAKTKFSENQIESNKLTKTITTRLIHFVEVTVTKNCCVNLSKSRTKKKATAEDRQTKEGGTRQRAMKIWNKY
jgi:hypothetical protein